LETQKHLKDAEQAKESLKKAVLEIEAKNKDILDLNR
jgi:hypothetical protein